MSKKLCEICTQNEHKYKCPKCRIVYCSLGCYKTHKEICQAQHPQSVQNEVTVKLEVKENITETNENILDNNTEVVTEVQGTLASLLLPNETEAKTIKVKSEDSVFDDKLRLLDDSEELKSILKNKHLRDLLDKINTTNENNIDRVMDIAMQEPLFTEFSNVCLKIVQDNKDLDKPFIMPNNNAF